MFIELMPLLTTRGLILTAGVVKNGLIRVTITPRPTAKDESKDLVQPFVVEGTAEELDSDFPKAIEGYTCELLTLERSLAQLKANTDAVLKEAKAESDKKIAEAKKKTSGTAKPAAKAEVKPQPPAPPSLFDAPTETTAEQPAISAAEDATEESPDSSDDDPDPDGTDSTNDSDESSDEPSEPFGTVASPSAVTPITQPNMFDKEEEILKEAFDGVEDNLLAA